MDDGMEERIEAGRVEMQHYEDIETWKRASKVAETLCGGHCYPIGIWGIAKADVDLLIEMFDAAPCGFEIRVFRYEFEWWFGIWPDGESDVAPVEAARVAFHSTWPNDKRFQPLWTPLGSLERQGKDADGTG